MKSNQIFILGDEKFRRLTGIKRATFKKIVEILQEADKNKRSKGGRKSKLSIEEQLLMTLEYIREYRTYFHIGQSYGISESSAYKAVKWVEDTLIKHPDFSLPSREALSKSDIEYETILIDTTESPIQRPKKDKNITIQARRRDIL